MKCPECGVEVNEQISRCHSCHAHLIKKDEPAPRKEKLIERTKSGMPFLFLVGYLLLLVVVTFPLYAIFANRQKTEALLENLETLQESLDDYADRFNSFPENIDQLINEGFIDGFGKNPYHERLMKQRHVGQSFAGDFTYIPIYDSRGQVMSYVLVGYGGNLKKGKDIFTEGHDYSRVMVFFLEPDGIPDGVVIVLEGKRGTHQV